jgi:hypothetical protein
MFAALFSAFHGEIHALSNTEPAAAENNGKAE